MTITKQVLNRLKCECVLVPFLVAYAHWYNGPVIMQSKRPVIMFSNSLCPLFGMCAIICNSNTCIYMGQIKSICMFVCCRRHLRLTTSGECPLL